MRLTVFFPCPSADRQFGQERIVVWRNRVVLIDGAVDADPDAARRQICRDRSGARHEIVSGVLGIDAALNGMALQRDILLSNLQWLAGGDGDLIAHDIDGRDLLRHRMFDLEARIHFDEIEMALLIQEKFDRAGIVVVHRLGDGDGGVAHLRAQLRREYRARGRFRSISDGAAGWSNRVPRGE